MRPNAKRFVTLLLALTFVISCLAGCVNDTESGTDIDATKAETSATGSESATETGDHETTGNSGSTIGSETETKAETDDKKDELAATKAEIGNPDWGKKSFACLVSEDFQSEIYAKDGVVDSEGGSAQVLNDAVLSRNRRLEAECNLNFDWIIKSVDAMSTAIYDEAMVAPGEFILIDYMMRNGTTTQALAGHLRDWDSLGIDVDRSWWDSGTADFALRGKVYFMTGDANFHDDNFTYVMIFNKNMQKVYESTVPNPYQTVLDWEWTLDYFNTITQGISANSNGDDKWDENDTYGFVATYEGNSFFIGADLRYIKNDRTMEAPELILDANMDKALEVLELTKTLFHANHATYMSPLGEEYRGLSCFKEGRAMFYSEIASYLTTLSSDMDTDYGVLPIPKYDKAQEYYRTWTYCGAPALSVTAAVSDADAPVVGKIIQWYAMLSSEEVKPAFYDVMLTSRNVRDEESRQMLDIIFSNRVYEMSFYFVSELGDLYYAFRDDVCENQNGFSRKYKTASKRFDRNVRMLFHTLDQKET